MGNMDDEFSVHRCIWHNDIDQLKKILATKKCDIEKIDPRGRTPLMLAVSLDHIECAQHLIEDGADANFYRNGWNVQQEACSTGDPQLLSLILKAREHQRAIKRFQGIPELLRKLKEAPDFYVEMKWEFTSWVPFMSRMCPSDTYKVWKSGAFVRVDTTLLGFDNMNWQRGRKTFIFKGDVNKAEFLEVDHETETVFVENIKIIESEISSDLFEPDQREITHRLTTPLICTTLDTDKIVFDRCKSGMWGWRSDKNENINGYEAKIFSAANVDFVTKTRSEHMSKEDKDRHKEATKGVMFLNLLSMAEDHRKSEGLPDETIESIHVSPVNPLGISPENYLNADFDLGAKDIGRPMELSTKIQKFKMTLSLVEHHPLTLHDQILPIVDLMAISNPHFQKLQDFITLQIPSGFPVKIEIPLFHVLNAKITFGNLNSENSDVEYVTKIVEDVKNPAGEVTGTRLSCYIDSAAFDIPSAYDVHAMDPAHPPVGFNEGRGSQMEDELLQLAIQRSLDGDNCIGFYDPNSAPLTEDQQLQRALVESMSSSHISDVAARPQSNGFVNNSEINPKVDDDLATALAASLQETATRDETTPDDDDEQMKKVMELSLVEK